MAGPEHAPGNKDFKRITSAQALNEEEFNFHNRWDGDVVKIIRDVDDVIEDLGMADGLRLSRIQK